jgi:hypothetical protein
MSRKPHECVIVKCECDSPFHYINSGMTAMSYHFRIGIPRKTHTSIGVSNIECMLVCVKNDLTSKFRGQNFYKGGGM